MRLQIGDKVKVNTGEVGTVAHINRLPVFVAVQERGQPDRMLAKLESKLTKIDEPADPPANPRTH